MKTVKDLRKVILENDGQIKIGELEINHKEKGDIDFKLKGDLMIWICSSQDEEAELSQVSVSINEDINSLKGDVEKTKQTIQDLKENKSELEEKILKQGEKIQELLKKYDESKKGLGKIEAYEKLLIGRTVSIGE